MRRRSMAPWVRWLLRGLGVLTALAVVGGLAKGPAPIFAETYHAVVARIHATAAAGVSAPTAAADWPTYGGDIASTFADASAITAADVSRLQPAWSLKADGEVAGNPIVVGNQLFFDTYGGTVYAVTRQDGAVLWTKQLDGSPINGGALYDNGRLFVATSGGRVFALDPATGAVLWSTGVLFGDLKDALRASPRGYGGILYESLGGTDDDLHEQGGVVAINEETGQVLWKTMLVRYAGGGAAVFAPPAVIPALGELVVGTGNPTPYPGNAAADGQVPPGDDPYSDSLVALSLQDGHVLWATQAHSHDGDDEDYLGSPNAFQLAGGRWVVGDGSKDGSYRLLDAATGSLIWQTDLTVPDTSTLIVATAATAGGRIFVGTMDVAADAAGDWPQNYQAPAKGRLVALDAATGKVLWSEAMPGAIAAAPAATADLVFTVLADGTVVAAEAASGRPLWQTHAPGAIWNAEAGLTLAGSTLVVPLADPGGVAVYGLAAPATRR